ncbi:hypothetical protein Van01_29120 [Micromonospora andamanensis]|uniref:Uncharacterized protein n=1 Tax=Micromonospora andamanensis TaxID=1287068 RepID=A0ABQ4HVL0_9ACTN|nr:hypothetical protein Van01_29120 [Micromonospora andamanensis]
MLVGHCDEVERGRAAPEPHLTGELQLHAGNLPSPAPAGRTTSGPARGTVGGGAEVPAWVTLTVTLEPSIPITTSPGAETVRQSRRTCPNPSGTRIPGCEGAP